MTTRQMQVIRNPRAIGQVGDRQFVADSQAQHLAKARGFIQFSQDATGQPATLVAVVRSRQAGRTP
jgi:hypothetical protein